MNFAENELLLNRYRLKRLIGKGGFSVVWKAYDEITDVSLAIKIYAPDKGLDDKGVKQFVKEYKLTQPLNHASLLKATHYDLIPEMNAPFLVMPFCERGSLSSKLMDEDVLSEKEAARLMVEIGSGLDYLHRQNPSILHQDIKPDNILLGDDGGYLLTDFGISNKMRSTLKKSTIGYSALTVAYAPPEKYANKPISAGSDIFSFGIMLYECLTGDVPWGGDGGVMLLKGAYLPDLPNKYPDRLNKVIKACLAQNPEQRPQASQIAAIGGFYKENGHWPKPENFIEDNTNTHSQFVSSEEQPKNQKSITKEEEITEQDAIHFLELPTVYSRTDLDKAYERKKGRLKKEINKAPFNSLKISLNKDLEKLEDARALAQLMLKKRKPKSVKERTETNDNSYGQTPQRRKTEAFEDRPAGSLQSSKRKTQAYDIQDTSKSPLEGFSSRSSGFGEEEEAHEEPRKKGKSKMVIAAAFALLITGGVLWYTVFSPAQEKVISKTPVVASQKMGDKSKKQPEKTINNQIPVGEPKEKPVVDKPVSEKKLQPQEKIPAKKAVKPEKQETKADKPEKKTPVKKVKTDYYALAIQKLGRNEYQGAIEAFKKAGEQDHARALYNLGVMYLKGTGMMADQEMALDYFMKAADQGSPEANFQAGYMYANGQGTDKNIPKAIEYYKRAAEQGDVMAMNNLGQIYIKSSGPLRNYAAALEILEKASALENPSALNNLANMYRHGMGTTEDYGKAAEFYKKAAKKGSAAAQNSLGNMYQYGLGVEKDYLEAFLWYRQAASQGFADAQNNLGYMYYKGLGVSKDESEARNWFARAAAKNHDIAENNLNNL
ncbi:MAG: protein kinase [Bacteroidales bacterium]|nr:protein kinase [Bacteroidales bacterium]MCF8333704.1 protein kinase [Bacteroidales bacterium]